MLLRRDPMKKTQLALFASIAMSASVPVLAQQANSTNNESVETIERIVVTADFRSTTLEQLASSATVLDQVRMMQRQPQHLDALLGAIPNVNVASGASRGRFVQIRGIGERSQFSEPLNPSVSFELDNIDLTGLFGLANPFDIAQVEVLRGPQATEFGVGALAGAMTAFQFTGVALIPFIYEPFFVQSIQAVYLAILVASVMLTLLITALYFVAKHMLQ